MNNVLKSIIVVIVVIYSAACVKPFNPPVLSTANLNLLVVDGLVIPGSASTIRLSRTVNISDSFVFVPERNAQLFVESLSGTSFSFQAGIDGEYTAVATFISPDEKYRLRILLQDGKEYVSDYVEVKKSPPIDGVEWDEDRDVSVYVNTHDPEGKARYYKWEYEETNEYRATYDSFLDFQNGEIIFLEPDQYRYACFKFRKSTDIAIGTSSVLSEDVIKRARIAIIPNDGSRLTHKYSMLVKQYAITPDAYKYWQTLQANTENNGTLFDPQPAQIKSNIHNMANPSEPVIGFVSISNFTEKRIFIRYTDLKHRVPQAYSENCDVSYIDPSQASDYLSDGVKLPAYFSTGRGLAIAPAYCVDCRLQGGVTTKPSYW